MSDWQKRCGQILSEMSIVQNKLFHAEELIRRKNKEHQALKKAYSEKFAEVKYIANECLSIIAGLSISGDDLEDLDNLMKKLCEIAQAKLSTP